jgi:carboxyl-terminal processing protease
MNATVTKKALAVLGVLAVLCVGLWWGGHPGDMPSFLRSAFVANPHDVVVDEALSDIQNDYFRPVGRGGLLNGAIAGAVASLGDPYAEYETPQEYDDFNNPPSRPFAGVGIDVTAVRAGLLVEEVIPGTPAERAGLAPGDVIVAVNGRSLATLSSKRALALIRGRPGSTVTLRVRRGSRGLRFALTRRLISTPLVDAAVHVYRGVKLGVIVLPTFDVPGVHADVAQNLELLRHQGVKGIVLDLRNNGGGLVTEAQLVVSLFLEHGVIVTTRGREQPPSTVSATGDAIAPKIPLAVLVNGDTASAAEIATGALQDHHRAVVVGTRTYGKGVFQEIRPLSNGGAIVITVGQYYLPNGTNLGAGGLRRGPGIKPDVTVPEGTGAHGDPQLQAALAVLAAKAR